MFKKILLVFILINTSAFSSEIIFLRQNSAPKYDKDGSGLCDLIYAELLAELKIQNIKGRVVTTNFPIKRILKMIKEGEASAFCGASKTSDREEVFLFSKKPVYEISNVFLAHADNSDFPTNLESLAKKNYKIGTFYGTATAEFIRPYSEKFITDQITTLEDAQKLVAQKKIDLFFYHDLALNHLVKNSNYPLKVIPVKYRSIKQYLLMSKKLPQTTIDLLNMKIENLYSSKKINTIWEKFLN